MQTSTAMVSYLQCRLCLQSVNAHVRRLGSEKLTYQEEFEQYKVNLRMRFENLLRQCKCLPELRP